MHSTHILLVVATGLLCTSRSDAAATVPSAHLEGVTQKPLSEVLQGPARMAYESARLLLEANDSATAHAKFKEAYELSKAPRLLWNMAACSKLQRHYSTALAELEHFLADGAGQLTSEQESRARELSETLRAVVAPVEVHVTPAAATLHIDGEARPVVAGELRFLTDVGRHDFHADHVGYTSDSRTIYINDTKAVVIDLRLVPIVPNSFLAVTTQSDAAIEVDGKPFSVGPWEAVVPSGVHSVKAWARGHKPWSSSVTVGIGEHKAITAVLEAEDKPNWWAIGTASAVAIAGLGVGAYYIFKPDPLPAPPPIFLLPTPGVGATISLP